MDEYLAPRRSLGFELKRTEWLLRHFVRKSTVAVLRSWLRERAGSQRAVGASSAQARHEHRELQGRYLARASPPRVTC